MNRKKNAGIRIGGFKRMGHRSTVKTAHGNKNIKNQLAREAQAERLNRQVGRRVWKRKEGM